MMQRSREVRSRRGRDAVELPAEIAAVLEADLEGGCVRANCPARMLVYPMAFIRS